MTANSPPPEILTEVESLRDWLRGHPPARMALVHDIALNDAAVLDAVRRELSWHDQQVVEVAVTPTVGLDDVHALARRTRDAEVYVAVGGGSVLDLVKLTVLVRTEPTAESLLATGARSGFIAVGNSHAPRPELVAVPTTLGTGSETSSVAVVVTSAGRRLVSWPAMRPDIAVLVPLATEGLPGGALMAGALEVIMRLTGFYIGSSPAQPMDALAETLVDRVVSAADRANTALRSGRHPAAEDRREIAIASALSQTTWLLDRRDSFCFRPWYVANETSHLLGCTKMEALAAIVPGTWGRIIDGESRLGDAERLVRIWSRVAHAQPGVSRTDPATGLHELCRHWGIAPAVIEAASIPVIARNSLRAWGAGLPMLGTLGVRDVEAVLGGIANIG